MQNIMPISYFNLHIVCCLEIHFLFYIFVGDKNVIKYMYHFIFMIKINLLYLIKTAP